MTSPNHIAGGFVFTGVFCSLFDINILSNPFYISFTILGSLLPDIDHTKSLIGKLFYPLAKWLSIKYGHRTITHSLIFLLSITLLVWIIVRLSDFNIDFVYIIFFSILSHLILDMVTVFGIPFFYPFLKNPCVIPANPNYRLRVNDYKSEGIAFFIFAFSGMFLQNLFANGFWNNYNQNFNDISHVYRIHTSDLSKATNIEFDINLYQKNIKGSAVVLDASNKSLVLFSDSVFTLEENKNGLKIGKLYASKSDFNVNIDKIALENVSLDSLYHYTDKKVIKYASLVTSLPCKASSSLLLSNKIELNYVYGLNILCDNKITLKDSISTVLAIEKARLLVNLEKKRIFDDEKPHLARLQRIKQLKTLLISAKDDYTINEIKTELIYLKNNEKSYFKKDNYQLPKLEKELADLLLSNSKQNTASTISGFVELYSFN